MSELVDRLYSLPKFGHLPDTDLAVQAAHLLEAIEVIAHLEEATPAEKVRRIKFALEHSI